MFSLYFEKFHLRSSHKATFAVPPIPVPWCDIYTEVKLKYPL